MSLVFESCNTGELCIALGSNEQILYQLREKLEDWISLQPHLPQDTPKKRLEWILLTTKMNLELSKQKLGMYYSMKQLVPELFTNRDPCGPNMISVHDVMQFVMLPKLGPGNCRTFILRFTETDSSKVSIWEIAKYLFMIIDIRMVEDHCSGDIVVFDLSKVSLGHLMKFTPTCIKKCEVTGKKAYGTRIKGFHLINAPPFVDYLITVLKSILHPKLSARLHVYPANNLEEFYEFVPKSILPKDYGGNELTMTELHAGLREKVDEWRNWFIEHEKIQVNKHSRPTPAINEDSVFGFSGSFRKIEVD